MARPHPGSFTVSSQQYHRPQRILIALLALAGIVGCSTESPTGLHSPEPAAPGKQLMVPNNVSFLTQAEVDATKAEVENSRIGFNDMNYQTYAGMAEIASRYTSYTPPGLVEPAPPPPPPPPPPSDPYDPYSPPPSDCTAFYGCPAYSLQMSDYLTPSLPRVLATRLEKGKSVRPRFFYTFEGEDPCEFYRSEMRRLGADYARAYSDFWENIVLVWKAPQNWWIGGPRDVMRNTFRQMYFVALAAKSHNCTRPPRGGWMPPQ